MLALLVSLWIAVAGRADAAPARCFRYQRDSVALRGQVIRRVYPGRPNYESIRQGDQPDTVDVLRLAAPLCIDASSEGEARSDVHDIQLYFSRVDAAAVRAMAGKTMILRGTLEEWTFGWHHLPVLLQVHVPRASSAF